jgi:hypothetical protein
MAEVALSLPDGRDFLVTVPDGQQRVLVRIEQCDCGCERWFQATVPHQRFLDETHQKAFHNLRQPRKTQRKQKK